MSQPLNDLRSQAPHYALLRIIIFIFLFALYLPAVDFAATKFDFNGDLVADFAYYHPLATNSEWWIYYSGGPYPTSPADFLGGTGDRIVPGKYDNDNKTDVAVYHSNGVWEIHGSSAGNFTRTLGALNDIPQPADYNGDGMDELAVFNSVTGIWQFKNALTGASFPSVHWGTLNDKPVACDYDGDGKADMAIFRTTPNEWWILNSSAGHFTLVNWGNSNDALVPADYDADGKCDIAVYDPLTAYWDIRQSIGSPLPPLYWGLAPNDIPVPADYNGDGRDDPATYRGGQWWVHPSTPVVFLGGIGDEPIPHAYIQ